MRLRSVVSLLALVVASCGAGELGDTTTLPSAPSAGARAPAGAQIVDQAPIGPPAEIDTRPVWEGFAATREESHTLAAYARGPVEIFAQPGDAQPTMTLEPTTILGTVTVLGVVAEPEDGWVEVMLPVRPNGTTGWAKTDDLSLYVADSKIVVDLGERRLSYLVDGVEVLTTQVGIGSRYNETPTGEFFVTDSVTMANPNSPWGPHALGLSARSETVTRFNGGDGIIGIHGTNNPSSIGANISLGCVRLPNEVITELHALVPIGTRVEIRA